MISAETNLWPQYSNEISARYPSSHTRFRYVNAGSFIGYAWYLKKMFHEMNFPADGRFDDQYFLNVYYFYHQDEIFLDKNADLFLCLHGVDSKDIEVDAVSKRIICKETGAYSSLFHGNGGGKGLFYNLLKIFYYKKNPRYIENWNGTNQ